MTMLALLGLLPRGGQTTGQARLDGRDLLAASADVRRDVRGKDVAMVFQDPMTSLHPMLTIGRQLTEHVRVHLGIGRARRPTAGDRDARGGAHPRRRRARCRPTRTSSPAACASASPSPSRCVRTAQS